MQGDKTRNLPMVYIRNDGEVGSTVFLEIKYYPPFVNWKNSTLLFKHFHIFVFHYLVPEGNWVWQDWKSVILEEVRISYREVEKTKKSIY